MDISKFSVKESALTPEYGEFTIEPLPSGFGYTVGHAIRRVLYTSIPGSAITSVKITGVKHKFSTLPGLKENIVDLLLNLKDVHVKLLDSTDTATLKISVKGNKKVTTADIQLPAGVEISNKDQYIGSLSGEKAKLEMEMTVEKGFGYVLAEDSEIATLGVIATDAIFTPVKRVTYDVEATRVGGQTDLDKLVIKIWTNGSIAPDEAFKHATKLLAGYFTQIYAPKSEVAEDGEDADTSATAALPASVLNMTIDELDLPTRIYNSLRNGGIETVENLLQTPKKELIAMRNMGGKSISVIEEKLREKGIDFTV